MSILLSKNVGICPLFTCQVSRRDIYHIYSYAEIIKICDILMTDFRAFWPRREKTERAACPERKIYSSWTTQDIQSIIFDEQTKAFIWLTNILELDIRTCCLQAFFYRFTCHLQTPPHLPKSEQVGLLEVFSFEKRNKLMYLQWRFSSSLSF